MSAGFDPYHKLLGIPPEEQPPNHYRLLGLSRKFEDDIEVIENCSNRVMQSLRQHQSGAHGPEIAKLLNEVSAARRTLLNPEKKQAYDDELRAAESASEEPIDVPESAIEIGHGDLLSKFKRRKNVLAPIFGTAVLLLVAVVGYSFLGKEPAPVEKIVEQEPDNESPAEIHEEKKVPVVASGNNATESPDVERKAVSPPRDEKTPGLRIRRPAIDLPVVQRGQASENLISLVDPVKDGSVGDWIKDESGISSKSSKESVLVLPFDQIPSCMDIDIGIERLDDGPGEFFIQLPTSVKVAIFGFDAGSPPRTGAYVDSDKLENAPRSKEGPLFETKGVRQLKLSTSSVGLKILQPQAREQSFYAWGGDIRRLGDGPPGFPLVPKRIVFLTRGARFKIHFLKYMKTGDSSIPEPPATVDGTSLISIINQSRDALRGDWGDNNQREVKPVIAPGTPYGRLQIPVAVPEEYDLSINVELPDDKGEVVVGLPIQDRIIAFYLNSKQCGAMASSQNKPYSPDTFPAQVPVRFDFQVRKDTIKILKGEKTLNTERTTALKAPKSDEFSISWLTPDEQRRIYFGTTSSTYKILGIGLAANSGSELLSSIRPLSEMPAVAETGRNSPPDRPGFKRPEGSLTGTDETAMGREIPKAKEPTGAELESATNKVKTQFKTEIQKAKKPADRLAFAERLKTTAAGESGDSSVRFALLAQICDQAAAAGEPKLALDTIDDLTNSFECDALKLKADALKVLSKNTKDNDKIQLLMESLASLAHQAADQEKYGLAVDLYGISAGIATKFKNRSATEEANESKREMLERQEQFVKVEAARKALQANPADPTAQLVVGEYACLTRRDWNAGLRALRQSSDNELKSLAEKDLTQPATPAEQGQVAKEWLTYAQSGSQHVHAAYADRAVYWLTLAAENAQGLEQRQWQQILRDAVAARDWDQPYHQLLEKLVKSIEQKRVVKTATIGVGWSGDVAFDEQPEEPGILIGFDFRIKPGAISVNNQRVRTETVEIIRPIFQTAIGIKPSDSIDSELTGNSRVIQLRARKGYAVSGIRMQVQGSIYRLSVAFRKINGKGLESDRGYWSVALGSGNPNSTAKLLNVETRTVPAIGITGMRSKNYDRAGSNRRVNEIGFITPVP
ncbi:MAG: hypothetical protein JWM11_7001 [Planctomycetaceae bacterium]|nr:hypothetical protein [Planctomycetaceae bacterium]